MNPRHLAQVGLGLLGIWALLYAVSGFIQVAGIVVRTGSPLAGAVVVPVLLMLGLSYLLIFHNARAAAAIFPDVGDSADDGPAGVARILVALAGVLLVVQAAPSIINLVLSLPTVGADPTLRGELMRRFVGSLAPIAAGWYLITHSAQFVDFLQRPVAETTAEAE